MEHKYTLSLSDNLDLLYLSEFIFFQRAMEDIGLKTEEICDIFKIVASVLKLGNLQFVPTTNMDGTEGCSIANEYGQLKRHMNFKLCTPSIRTVRCRSAAAG